MNRSAPASRPAPTKAPLIRDPFVALFNPAYAAEVTADLDAIAARARAMGMKV